MNGWLAKVPPKYLRWVVIPGLLAALGGTGKMLLSAEQAWRAKVDAQPARVDRLERKVRAIHRDMLQFQLVMYEDRGMKDRAADTRLRLYHMDRVDLALENQENE